MLENLAIKDEEQKEFTRLKKIKGEYYLQQAYLILSDANKNPELPVNFTDIAAICKYEKNLKNLLQTFITIIIDMFKSEILKVYDVPKVKQYIGVAGTQRLAADIKLKSEINPDLMSNLYFGLKVDFNGLVFIAKSLDAMDQKYVRKVESVKALNNYLDHGNYIVLGDAVTLSGMYFGLDNLENLIEKLCDLLPGKYKESFEKALNGLKIDKLTGKPIIKRYCLSTMENGLFSRIR